MTRMALGLSSAVHRNGKKNGICLLNFKVEGRQNREQKQIFLKNVEKSRLQRGQS